ncbi:hypothetical protein [Mycobacterium haemophilum]
MSDEGVAGYGPVRVVVTGGAGEQFHRHLKHRNIFAESSAKWRDPRAHLLAGQT